MELNIFSGDDKPTPRPDDEYVWHRGAFCGDEGFGLSVLIKCEMDF